MFWSRSQFLSGLFLLSWCLRRSGTACFVSNFCLLNDVIRDLPKIQDVYRRREGFQWVTSLDLTSQFYHFLLRVLARKLCIINNLFGLYRYLPLPMGLKISPCFVQAVLSIIFADTPYVEVFLDDITIFARGSFKLHLHHIREVLSMLGKANFSIKPKKCEWCKKEIFNLGSIISCKGIRPDPSNVAAILHIEKPCTPKQLRSLLACSSTTAITSHSVHIS